MNETLNGKWSYRSFRHDPIVLKDGQVQGTPELATPWSPPGVLEVTTGATGEVMGTLTFAPGVALKVSGKIIPAADKSPASVELTGEGLTSVNKIKGFFIPGSDHVVGTIMCLANDLSKTQRHLGAFRVVSGQRVMARQSAGSGGRAERLTGSVPNYGLVTEVSEPLNAMPLEEASG